ncbi:hypothetical protein [Sphingomonas abaci]|uniref:Uncharacterized protein n=1 Tax=Sphingomonas abaci TaxID=237611 RepID=A0A7W7AI52_9SPHN|nr:hypothetical protein [Sphingomonas abaci]MBB4616679.1 hypothetical protein [Sphingomonas abaci]
MANYSAMIGLGVLSGNAGIANSFEMPKIETKAQRLAKAAFTTPVITAPWKEKPSTASIGMQVSQIKSMKSVVDKPSAFIGKMPDDVKTVFTAYKASERLRMLAEAATKPGVSEAERAGLQKAFAKGLADMKAYLSSAPSDKVDLAYGRAARQVQSVGIQTSSTQSMTSVKGELVADSVNAPLSGLVGNEKFSITLKQYGTKDTVTLDLSKLPQPPSLSDVVKAANAAISAVPKLNADGSALTDSKGNQVSRYVTRFATLYTPTPSKSPTATQAEKDAGRYSLQIQQDATESLTIDQIGGDDAVMVAAGFTERTINTDTNRDGTPVKVGSTTSAVAAALTRFDRAGSDLERRTLTTLNATDRIATEGEQLRQESSATRTKTGTKDATVMAALTTQAMVTDAEGNSYIVGTTAGDLGTNRGDGKDDLALIKVSSEGKVLWQRTLGTAGSAQGAAITLAPDGGIVVAGTVTGGVDAANSDGDMLVTRFDAAGDSSFETVIRSGGTDVATALAVAADGKIVVGGRRTGSDGNGNGFLVSLSATGVERGQRTIDAKGSEAVRSLAFGTDGSLVALTNESGRAVVRTINLTSLDTDRAKLDLGMADARALAVASDGTIAVAGATSAEVAGGKVNTMGGGRDGFLTRIASDLTSASTSYIGTSGNDQIDSVRFMNGAFYVGGRTDGDLAGKRSGSLDAFVARIGVSDGAIGATRQFGSENRTYEPVIVSAASGGSTVLSALGLRRGTLTPEDSTDLEAQTDIRPGDSFKVKVNGGREKAITIAEGETLSTLTEKVRKATGTRFATVSMSYAEGGRALRIAAQPGQEIELIAGSNGRDALAKLGLDARRITAPATVAKGAPLVTPGGSFGLDLSDSLTIATKDDAKIALARMEQAVSYSQSAYRSLYWDDAKAARADPQKNKGGGDAAAIARINAQTASYQDALARLSSASSSSFSFGF